MSHEIGYSYLAPSALSAARTFHELTLATSGGSTSHAVTGAVPADHPFFFSGFVERPDVVAQALLVVARVARTRFYTPPNMVAAILLAADPVVTSTLEGLRFESFSACCGVYARLDLDAEALDAWHVKPGVTNIDVSPPLRQALAGLPTGEPLRLNVGEEELRVATLDAEVVERKVALPKRWLKGFADSQALSSAMSVRLDLDAAQARRFVQALPRASTSKTVLWATPAIGSVRLASRASPESVCVAGPERLRVIEPLLHFATGLRAYGSRAPGSPVASGWVLELPGGRLTIGLSPEKSRGFSGEGAVLHALSKEQVYDDADLVSAPLSYDARVDRAWLAARTGLSAERVADALTLLAASGQVGHDFASGAFFHRPMPYQPDALLSLNPRLAGARKLAGAVAFTGPGQATVRSGDT
ncbi:MAG: hypothetical protein LBK95_09150 [Bifidobacteriaceae bacterium]|jgi:hypothetical protein|nr:hypothetical protein [Bifidobacteriaceae bacterium]